MAEPAIRVASTADATTIAPIEHVPDEAIHATVAEGRALDAIGRAEILTCLDASIARGGEFVLRHVEAGEQGFIDMWERMGGMDVGENGWHGPVRPEARVWAAARPDSADALA